MNWKLCETGKYGKWLFRGIQQLSIHSFIHYVKLYSAYSRLLLRSAPDSSTDKNSCFKARVECVRVNPGEQSQCQWKPIPNRCFKIISHSLHVYRSEIVLFLHLCSPLLPASQSICGLDELTFREGFVTEVLFFKKSPVDLLNEANAMQF